MEEKDNGKNSEEKEKGKKELSFEEFIAECISKDRKKDRKACELDWKVYKKRADILKGKIEDGQAFFITQRGCPSCEEYKSIKEFVDGLRDGSIIEVRDDDKELLDMIERGIGKKIRLFPDWVIWTKEEGFIRYKDYIKSLEEND